jgi:hypothetical protein
MSDVTRKPRSLRWAIVAATGVFLTGAVLPIWPVWTGGCCHWYGPLWESAGWAVFYFGALPAEVWVDYFGTLPPTLGGLVFLTGLTGVLRYRWVARR